MQLIASITGVLTSAKGLVNHYCDGKEPWQIIAISASSTIATVYLYDFIVNNDEDLTTSVKKKVFRLGRKLPFLKNRIDEQLSGIQVAFEKDFYKRISNLTFNHELPRDGLQHDEILQMVQAHAKLGDYDWQDGKVTGTVYYYSDDMRKLMTNVYGLSYYTNPLHCDVFPGINKLETEVVSMVAKLFHGHAHGTMTSGGTESILLACKAYRDYARDEHGITKPEMVLSVTAHSAFDKAAQYFKIRTRYIPVDGNYQVDIRRMKAAINSNTIMLIGSVPNYPYGTMDDIEAISKLGVKYNVPVHVDACLGGFIVAFADKLGYKMPLFDFQLPGVTSLSVDTHKYGLTPKGSSVILYSEAKYRAHQFTVTTDWPGGVYGSPTISGSRPGGSITTCWATMMAFGYNGYLSAAKDILSTTRYIENELRKLEGIFIFGQPVSSVIGVGSKVFNIYRLSDALGKRGWSLTTLQFPSGFHICVTHMHTQSNVAERFLDDFKNELTVILREPGDLYDGKLALYGSAQKIPDRTIVGDVIRMFIEAMYYVPKEPIQPNGNDV